MIIGLAGMPGSGKSVFVKVAREYGYRVVRMGDVVWGWVRKKGMEITEENVSRVATEERLRYGNGIWAIRTLDRVKKDKIVIDGIRTLEEINVFRSRFTDFLLVAIHASPETRWKRIRKRRRKDDTKTEYTFRVRDQRELRWGIGNAIAIADIMLVNESTMNEFKKECHEVMTQIEKKK